MKFSMLSIFTAVLCLAGSAVAEPPNVLFIAVDDLRPELNCYGADHMITPHMDRLAAEGRLFRNHYVQVPTCGASRFALFSGLRPTAATDANSAFDNKMPKTQGNDPESWVELLRRNGWYTASLGKVTHEPDGFQWDYTSTYDIGRTRATHPDMRFSWNEIVWDHNKWGAQRYPLFAYADGTGRAAGSSPAYEVGINAVGETVSDDAYVDGQTAQAAIDKLREFSEEGTRFCLGVGFMRPHLPFNAPKAYFDLYNSEDLPGPSPAGWPINNHYTGSAGEYTKYTGHSDRSMLRHAYFACVSYVDAQIGKILDALDTLGLSENTVVVLWGDHGYCLDDYGGALGKHRVLERALESPLIIRAPRAWNPEAFAGIQTEGVVETIDIYPTIAELCGLTPPAGPDGSSLVPMLRNPFAEGKDNAYARWKTYQTVRTPDWRLIDNGSGAQDLYDLSSYRYEIENISAANTGVVAQLNAALSVQGTRSGTNYVDWSSGNAQLADPAGDADSDGIPNFLEYGMGTDPMDNRSWKKASVEQGAEGVFLTFEVSTNADDFALEISSSTNLLSAAWGFQSLEFFDSMDLGDGVRRLRYRSTDADEQSRFFRLNAAE